MEEATPATERMYTVGETCEALGIGRTKFYALVNDGQLTAVNINPGARYKRVGEKGPRRALRVAASEIEAFKKRNSVAI